MACQKHQARTKIKIILNIKGPVKMTGPFGFVNLRENLLIID